MVFMVPAGPDSAATVRRGRQPPATGTTWELVAVLRHDPDRQPRLFEALALPGQECGSRERAGHIHTPITHGSWE